MHLLSDPLSVPTVLVLRLREAVILTEAVRQVAVEAPGLRDRDEEVDELGFGRRREQPLVRQPWLSARNARRRRRLDHRRVLFFGKFRRTASPFDLKQNRGVGGLIYLSILDLVVTMLQALVKTTDRLKIIDPN